ncbi:hypothetical protein [Proteus columbae]|nr:hypothetical protein [Proteus columbae]
MVYPRLVSIGDAGNLLAISMFHTWRPKLWLSVCLHRAHSAGT